MNGIEFTDIYVDAEIAQRVNKVLESTRYVKGEEAERFEEDFRDACGTEFAIAVNSGTSAVLLALKAAGVDPGSEVFVPAHTFFATVSPVLFLGAKPVFVDIDRETYTMDPDDLREAIEGSTEPAAVIPVHIYGQMADMSEITRVAEENGLTVIEDACQAHFSEREGLTAGAAGDIGCFSFYPSKNMTVGGDGGMITTDNETVASMARALRNHGRDESGVHRYLGLNHRLSEIHAAIGRVQLRHIRSWNKGRRNAANRYDRLLADVHAVTTPTAINDATHVYHLYVIQVKDRDGLRAHLQREGIDTGIHYPTPVYKHPAITARVETDEYTSVEQLCDRILSLPIHPRITTDEIDQVCETVEGYYQ